MKIPFQQGGELVSDERDFAVVERARIEGRKTPEDLSGDGLLLLGRQGVKRGDYSLGNYAHGNNLASLS